MPIPHFEWKSYEVPADVGDPLRFEEALLAVAPAAASITVCIPDLSGYPKPRDKAKYLLHVAAEVEHALLVQYLYAAFSLKSYDEFSDSQQRSTVDNWSGELRSIAKQEMGHLMAAQNMLLALGLPPYLEREEFPSIKDLYPFKFQLEPLSQRSLAKYVTAEAPLDATGIDEIVDLATDTEHQKVNHVGTIYGLLGVVLSTKQEIKEGLGNPSWDKQLREVMAAAYKQQPDPDKWHLDDGAIDRQSLDFQAIQHDWPSETADVTIYHIEDRDLAREAIRQIAEQGEGPTDGGEESHFARFLRMYRGQPAKNLLPFPAADAPGAWNPARAVPLNPGKPPKAAANRTDRWEQLANQRYELLLGFINHYLLTSATDDRGREARKQLASWAQNEMFALNPLRNMLVTLPLNGGVAAPPFTLPDTLELPATEPERWSFQLARTRAAIDMILQTQAADPADAKDTHLMDLLNMETMHLAQIEDQIEQLAGGTRAPTTSFDRDV